LSELAQRFSTGEEGARGEMVLMIDRKVIGGASCASNSSEISSLVAALEAEGVDARTALKKAAKKLGISRDEAYRRLSAERSREKA
jgi:predicted transcriptional regulator YheO